MNRFAENGYEIVVSEDRIVFIDRKTWGLSWAMVGLSLAVVALALIGAWGVGGSPDLQFEAIELACLVSAAVLVIGVWFLGRIYRRRRIEPAEDIPDILIFDRHSGLLRDRTGTNLARIDELKARMHIDWWTRGTMRVVVLSWPGGRRIVHRSFGRRRSLAVLGVLRTQGIDVE